MDRFGVMVVLVLLSGSVREAPPSGTPGLPGGKCGHHRDRSNRRKSYRGAGQGAAATSRGLDP